MKLEVCRDRDQYHTSARPLQAEVLTKPTSVLFDRHSWLRRIIDLLVLPSLCVIFLVSDGNPTLSRDALANMGVLLVPTLVALWIAWLAWHEPQLRLLMLRIISYVLAVGGWILAILISDSVSSAGVASESETIRLAIIMVDSAFLWCWLKVIARGMAEKEQIDIARQGALLALKETRRRPQDQDLS